MGRYLNKENIAEKLLGGVIMDVTTPEQAKIAEASGACAVMALEFQLIFVQLVEYLV